MPRLAPRGDTRTEQHTPPLPTLAYIQSRLPLAPVLRASRRTPARTSSTHLAAVCSPQHNGVSEDGIDGAVGVDSHPAASPLTLREQSVFPAAPGRREGR